MDQGLLHDDFMKHHGALRSSALNVDSFAGLDSEQILLSNLGKLAARRGIFIPSSASARDVDIDRLLPAVMLKSLRHARKLRDQLPEGCTALAAGGGAACC